LWIAGLKVVAEKEVTLYGDSLMLSQATPALPEVRTLASTLPIVVIGNGPVGMRLVAELSARNRKQPVILYGEEEHLPYDRVKLSSWLSGELDLEGISKPYRRPFGARLEERYGTRVTEIDRVNHTVTDICGVVTHYSRLVIATGSVAYVPPIPGIETDGVFTLRNMDDAVKLMARRVRSHHTVVIGGGLLGLEAARGMQPTNTPVTIVEHVDRLMANQLDERSGELLKETIESMGFDVVVGDGIREIKGSPRLNSIVLHSGKTIECDTIVVATGIRPNIDLAKRCGLAYGRGITVDDGMKTSDERIYAIGECAEHRGEVYGLVSPGFEQAGVAASDICGQLSQYNGSIIASRLKVVGTQVFSVGPVGYTANPLNGKSLVYEDRERGLYRKLLVERHKLTGAIGLGEWDQSLRTQAAVNRMDRVYPWQRLRFLRTGNLWSASNGSSVTSWPENTTVCQCTGTDRGRISESIVQGAESVEAIGAACGAGTVCGSCKPLLAELIGSPAKASAVVGTSWLVGFMSLATILCLLYLFSPALPYAYSVQQIEIFGQALSGHWDMLWRSGLLKQITGFTILASIVLASVISIRKRTSRLASLCRFDSWRIAHLAFSVIALLALFLHSGFRLGSGLNFVLMSNFLALSVLGILTTLAISLGHKFSPAISLYVRKHSLSWHIHLLWPIPVLLGWHVFKGYWY